MLKVIIILFYFLFNQTVSAQTSSGSQSFSRVDSGSESEITAHGVCKKVSYNGPGGIFVPTRSAEEWNSFINANSNITSDCGTPIDCYTDSDGDGYGTGSSVSTTTTTCPAGQSANNTDCDDSNASFTTVCSSITCYTDGDGDGFGAGSGSTIAGTGCPSGQVTDNTDCDDSTYSASNTCASYNTFTCSSGSWAIGGSCGAEDVECNFSMTIPNGNSICCSSTPTATCDGGGGGGGGCFIAGSYVTTEDRRLEKIEDIKVGDKLRTAEGKYNAVVKLLRIPYTGPIYGLNGEKPFFTPNHPIKTVEGWKSLRPDLTRKEVPELEVEKLKVGDIVIKDTGLEAIMYMTKDYVQETVYNFTLNGDHEYLVNDLAVHNKLDCGCIGGGGAAGWSSEGGQGSSSGTTRPNSACAGGVDYWCGSGAPSGGGGGFGGVAADGTVCVVNGYAPDTVNGKVDCSDCQNSPSSSNGMFQCDGERYNRCGGYYDASCGSSGSFCSGGCADL